MSIIPCLTDCLREIDKRPSQQVPFVPVGLFTVITASLTTLRCRFDALAVLGIPLVDAFVRAVLMSSHAR